MLLMKANKKSFEEWKRKVREMQQDPELMSIARTFVLRHGGKLPS
jgi:hypothetical protein